MTEETRFVQKTEEEQRMANIEARNAAALRTLQSRVIMQRRQQANQAIARIYG